jgi:hypothetical protein
MNLPKRVFTCYQGRSLSKDKDLLTLDEPIVMEIVSPREFYRRLESK